MNGVLQFTRDGKPHTQIEEELGKALQKAYDTGVRDQMNGQVTRKVKRKVRTP